MLQTAVRPVCPRIPYNLISRTGTVNLLGRIASLAQLHFLLRKDELSTERLCLSTRKYTLDRAAMVLRQTQVKDTSIFPCHSYFLCAVVGVRCYLFLFLSVHVF